MMSYEVPRYGHAWHNRPVGDSRSSAVGWEYQLWRVGKKSRHLRIKSSVRLSAHLYNPT